VVRTTAASEGERKHNKTSESGVTGRLRDGGGHAYLEYPE